VQNTAGYPDGYPALNNIHNEKKRQIAAGHIYHRFFHHLLTDLQELGAY
jgi:hypothetical protein